ncbi:MAG TPA: glycosyltransferase family 9 protein [Bacteroidota bacterium]
MKSLVRQLELLLRHAVTYPILRLFFRNHPHDGAIRLTSVRRLLILRYDRIGDIVVTTPVFRRLKELHPDLYLGVLASQSNAALIKGNPFIDQIHALPARWRHYPSWLKAVRKEEYDVVLNFIFNRTTSGGVLANLAAPKAIKVGQGAEKYRFYFNKLLTLNRGKSHMSEVLMQYVNQVFELEAPAEMPRFELYVGAEAERYIRQFVAEGLSSAGKDGYVVLNISAAEPERTLSEHQSKALAQILALDCKQSVAVISAPGDAKTRKAVVAAAGSVCKEFPPEGTTDLLTVAALIRSAKCVVTPDTSIIHIASAVQTPVLGFYTPLRVTKEWMPHGVKCDIVLAEEGAPVSSIPVEVLKERTKNFLATI